MHFAARTTLFMAAAAAAVYAAASGPASAETVVKIGGALSMTGPAAVYGTTQKAGIQTAAEEVNRTPRPRASRTSATISGASP